MEETLKQKQGDRIMLHIIQNQNKFVSFDIEEFVHFWDTGMFEGVHY